MVKCLILPSDRECGNNFMCKKSAVTDMTDTTVLCSSHPLGRSLDKLQLQSQTPCFRSVERLKTLSFWVCSHASRNQMPPALLLSGLISQTSTTLEQWSRSIKFDLTTNAQRIFIDKLGLRLPHISQSEL